MFDLLLKVTLAVSKVRHLPHLPQLRYGHEYLSPLAQARSTQYNIMWFSLGTPVSSTNQTDRHDITESEISLKVALNTITLTPIFCVFKGMFPLHGKHSLQIHVFANGGEFEGEVVKTIKKKFINHFISHMQSALYLFIYFCILF